VTRKEKILAMLAEDPGDTFLRYSLAMELRGEGDHEASLSKLGELSNDSPPYIPAFFMAAQQLVELGRIEQARGRLRDGIDQARAQGDAHAAAEMSELLATLGALGEEDDL
jgi:thioredoxin-like negative regulator of GroEL